MKVLWIGIAALGFLMAVTAGMTALIMYGDAEDWITTFIAVGVVLMIVAAAGATYPRH